MENIGYESSKPASSLKKAIRSIHLYLLFLFLILSWSYLFWQYLPKRSSFAEGVDLLGSRLSSNNVEKDEVWYEIFMKDQKIGYKREELIPFEYGYLNKENTFLKIKTMGIEQEILIESRIITDLDFLIKNFTINIYSGALTSKITGKVENDHIYLFYQSGEIKTSHKLTLGYPFYIGNSTHFFKNLLSKMDLNESKVTFLNPITMKIDSILLRRKGKVPVEIRKSPVSANLFEVEYKGLVQKVFVDDSGRVLREEGMLGLRTERAEGPSAVSGIASSEDLAFMTSLEPKGKKISQPHRISGLRLRGNLGKIPEDQRQRFEGKDLLVEVEPLPTLSELKELPEPLKPYVLPSPGVESDHPKILELAKKLAGQDTNPVVITRRLLSFVYSKLEKRPLLSLPSAIGALEAMAGDCTEHALLLAALLRANNIPARAVGGITLQEGRFFYHAWNEAYLGNWISLDAALNQMPCDATHIKLFYFDELLDGTTEAFKSFVGHLGRLKLEIVDFKYD